MIIRSPNHGDVTKLVRLCRELHAESNWSWIPFSPAAMRKSVIAMMRRDDYRIFVAEEDGEMVGVLFGMVDEVLYGRTRYATDVEFIARRGGAQLLDAFRDWAKKMGAKVIIMGDSNGDRERAKERFFNQHGFTRTGGMFQERVK